MKKDGIGKLYCRICGYKYQKRLGPLDKQVDIYCAMIDEAETLNSKKQNEGIGFVSRKEEGEDDGALEDNEEDRLEKLIRAKKPARDPLAEEVKQLDNAADLDTLLRKNSGLSASHKIAEMGLGRRV
mmetsp:Transcript_21095/g.25947  ORF Transcript_21095/g.25947 Transcript_21095/m.25947 type:complete len:127 (-) Transcript_21095:450-830(-)